jgi:hypothetical protein
LIEETAVRDVLRSTRNNLKQAMATEEPWKELYGYWRSRQVDGRAPKRSELDIPVDVPRLLANVMLIDCIAPGCSIAWSARRFGIAINLT